MSDYRDLLDAAILHLEEMKSRGARFVSVSADAVAALNSQTAVSKEKFSATPPASPNFSKPIPSVSAQAIAASRSAISVSKPPPTKPPIEISFSASGGAGAISKPALSPEAKAAAFSDLRMRVLACVKCPHLVSSRNNVVFGVGNADAQLMFVGEAPGADEDVQGEPFVGKAGQLLTKIIQTMGFSRETVYIANILKCRPDTPGQSAGNRKPTPEEMQTCIPYLHEQIDLIRPRALVALGATAVEGLLGKTAGITRLRGNWQTYRGIPLMPTYHPAFLLRNQSLATKREVWEDMLRVMEKLEMPVSEKQRNYFLAR